MTMAPMSEPYSSNLSPGDKNSKDFRIPMFGAIDRPRTDQDASEQEEDTLERLQSLYHIANRWRIYQEYEWELNALYLAGNQWDTLMFDPQLPDHTRRIPPQKDIRRSHATRNFIFSLQRQALTNFRGKMGRQIATPYSTSPMDDMRAEIATDFLLDEYDRSHQDAQQFYEMNLSMVTGRCLRMTYWDADAEVEVNGKKSRMGDIASETISPFRYHLDPWSERFDDCKFVIVSDLRDIEEVRALFPSKRDKIKDEDYSLRTHRVDYLLANVTGAPWQVSVPDRREMCILKRMYCRPSQRWPQGRVFWWTVDALLEVTDLPDGDFPFTPIDWFPVPLRQAPMPFITPLREPQRELNIQLSQIIDLANNQLRGDLVMTGAGKITQEIDEQTGQKRIHLPPGTTDVKFVPYDLNATTALTMLKQSWDDLQQLGGIRDPSLGDVPPGVRSGIAISLLQNKDTIGLELFKLAQNAAMEDVAKKKIMLAKKHIKVPRLLRVVGGGKLRKAMMMKGSELGLTSDVRTRTVSSLSEVEMAAQRETAAQQGLYGPYKSLSDKAAKCRALLATHLSNIEDEVEAICYPLTFEEVQRTAGEMDYEAAQVQRLQYQSIISQATQPQQPDQQGGMPGQAPGAPQPGSSQPAPGAGASAAATLRGRM